MRFACTETRDGLVDLLIGELPAYGAGPAAKPGRHTSGLYQKLVPKSCVP